MQFGPLSSRQAIDRRFKELRVQSRQELLSQIYGKNSQKTEATIEKELSQAFSAIMHSYDFDKANAIVLEIAQLFGLNLDSLKRTEPEQRQKLMQDIIQNRIEEALKIVERTKEEEAVARSSISDAQENHFQWLGLRTKYTELRPIFEQILLEKVKLFDSQLTRLTEYTESLPLHTIELPTTAREGLEAAKLSARSKTLQSSVRARRVQSEIQHQFCNVKIRDKSEFLLKRWTQREEESFLAKKAAFRSNLKINNIPVLFQFVKKYTETVKARDNIYRKWEQRERAGITPEEVRYLCATSLFLNNSLAKSEKRRIKNNVQSAGTHLISKLETNIAEKIIATYRQLMKRVSDLRAKYYEELTQMRKQEQSTAARAEEDEGRRGRRREVLVKYRAMFEKIVSSERMRLRLNERVYKWVRLFAAKLRQAVARPALAPGQSKEVFKRLTQPASEATLLYRLKLKYPSSKIIKREDQYSHRLKYRAYIPSERFHYGKAFEDSISKLNRLRLDSSHRSHFKKQLSGGPKQEERYVVVDLSKKQVFLSSPNIVRHIVLIQAKWRAVFTQKRFAVLLEESREAKRRQFAEKLESLQRLYPPGRRIDVRAVEGRLRRVNMKISNILQPYVRVTRRPINSYTSFCVNRLSAGELKSKHARNGKIRLGEFVKMVEGNQFALLKRSGIVVSSREINECVMGRGANAMWWAVFHSNLELVRLFLEGGGDANSRDAEGETCLHVAVRNGDVQIIFLLLDYGADLNRKNAKKSTCLMHATKKMLKLLGLEEGGLTGERDNNALFYRRAHHEEPYPEHYY